MNEGIFLKQFYFIAAFLFIFGIFSVNAQDLIILKNGNIIEAKVTEISPSEIRYQRYDHLDGPVIVIFKPDVLSIRYENGRVEVINEASVSSPPAASSAGNVPIITSVRVIPENTVVTRGWTQKFTAIVNDDETQTREAQPENPQKKEIPAKPQLGQATVLQQILNGLPAIPIAGRTLKFTFGGDTWIASLNKNEILGGTIIIQNTDEGSILTLQQTHTKVFAWIKTPGPEIVLEYIKGPPASLRLSSRSQNSEQKPQTDNTETSDPLQQVTWSVSGSENENTFIGSNGVLTVAADETSTELTVQAVSVHNTQISGSVSVKLQTSVVTGVYISPENIDVTMGTSRRFSATVTGTSSPPQDVTWTVIGSSNPNTAISSNGILTVSSNESSTTLTVRATSKFDTQMRGGVIVTILPSPPVNWLSAEFSVLGGGLRYEHSLNNFFSLGINAFYQTTLNDREEDLVGALAIARLFAGDSPFFFELGIGYGFLESVINYKTVDGRSSGNLWYYAHGFMVNPAIGLRFVRKTKGVFADIFFSVPIVFGQTNWTNHNGGTGEMVTPGIRYGIGIGGAW